MPKKYRLTGEEIQKLASVSGSTKRLHGAFFSLLYAPIDAQHTKIATVVSKKVAAKAVDRNSIKRRSRAALAKLIPTHSGRYALVFHAKKQSAAATYAEISRDIESLLRHLPH